MADPIAQPAPFEQALAELVQALVDDGASPEEAVQAVRAVAAPQDTATPVDNHGLLRLPPLPARPPRAEVRNISRPGSATLPAEMGAANALASPAAGGYAGGQLIGEGIVHGNPLDVAAGAGVTGLSMVPMFGSKRPAKPRLERFDDADTSHVGMTPWFTGSAGAGAGGYLGNKLDDEGSHKGAIALGALGTTLGFAGGILPVLSHARKMEEVERAAALEERMRRQAAEAAAAQRQRTAVPVGPSSAPATAQQPARTPLAQRLRELPVPQEVRRALDGPEDLAGPTGANGVIINNRGESVRQDASGNWKNVRTNRYTTPPDKDDMTAGFRDADLAAARAKK